MRRRFNASSATGAAQDWAVELDLIWSAMRSAPKHHVSSPKNAPWDAGRLNRGGGLGPAVIARLRIVSSLAGLCAPGAHSP